MKSRQSSLDADEAFSHISLITPTTYLCLQSLHFYSIYTVSCRENATITLLPPLPAVTRDGESFPLQPDRAKETPIIMNALIEDASISDGSIRKTFVVQ